tara:strand:- start:1782 stop:4886 length:3105 start_codon:yes stop_codon:yes gene_type:complete
MTTTQQQQFADKITQAIKDNKFAPENLNVNERQAVDVLIQNGIIKSEKNVTQILEERNKARTDIAQAETVARDPISAAFEIDDSRIPLGDAFFTGRTSSVLAGDIGGAVAYQYFNKDKIIQQYKDKGKLKTKGIRFFENLAKKLPPQFKYTKAAVTAAAKFGDTFAARPLSKLRGPLAKFELGTAVAGTAGAGVGSLAYDAADAILGEDIYYSIMEDLSEIPYKPPEKLNAIESALVSMKNAAIFNAAATGITPLFMAGGKTLNWLFGTTGTAQKKYAEFARDKGLDAPMLGFMRDGALSGPARNFFKTIGVFPGISPIADKALLKTEQTTSKIFFDNVESMAPVYHQSFLGQEVIDQMRNVYSKNVAAYDKLYDDFYKAADLALDPAIMTTDNIVGEAQKFLSRRSAEIPDAFKSFNESNAQAVQKLLMDGDPLNAFMAMVGSLKGKNITFKQFKFMNQLLNDVGNQTKYYAMNQEFGVLKSALELDVASFSKNLNANSLMKDGNFAAAVAGAGGLKSAGGKQIIDTTIKAGNALLKKMKDANEAFSRTMKLYDNDGYFLKKKLQKIDSNALTGKGLINFMGRTNMPKEELFGLFEDAVFASRSPSALKTYRQMIGAEKGFEGFSEQGVKLFKASFSKFLHDAYIGSFVGKPLQGAIDLSIPGMRGIGTLGKIFKDGDLTVKPFTEVMKDANRLQDLANTGGSYSSKLSADNIVNTRNYKFGPDDYKEFDANTFINTLGIGTTRQAQAASQMLEDAYFTITKDRTLAKKSVQELRDFAQHLQLLSDVPVTNSSTFIQRRLQLSGLGGLTGVAIGAGAGAYTNNPALTFLSFLLVGRYAGRVLVDPDLLRIVNDTLRPEEIAKIVKGRVTPKAKILPAKKRQTFFKALNKFSSDDADFIEIDPNNVDFEQVTNYLNDKAVSIDTPNYGPNLENIPESTLRVMYDEELTQLPTEKQKTEETNLYSAMDNSIQQARNAFEDPRDNIAQSEVPNLPLPQVPQIATQPTGQVTAEQVQTLFPFDTTTAAIAQRRQNRG